MKSVVAVGVDGSVWPLTARDHLGVFLRDTPDELVPGGDGEPIAGALNLVVADNSPDGERLRDVRVTERAWRDAWSPRLLSMLKVEDDEGRPHWARFKLSSPIPGFAEVDPEGYVDFSQSIVADSPWWWRTSIYSEPEARVINTGDADVWVRVTWQQAGQLVMPSGAVIALPEVPAPRTIHLDPEESCVVVDDSGVEDEVVWRSLRGEVFPEIVPAGTERVFGLPPGAVLVMDEGVQSPW